MRRINNLYRYVYLGMGEYYFAFWSDGLIEILFLRKNADQTQSILIKGF